MSAIIHPTIVATRFSIPVASPRPAQDFSAGDRSLAPLQSYQGMEPSETARINPQTIDTRQAYETLTSPAYRSQIYVPPTPSSAAVPGPEPPHRRSLFPELDLRGRPLPPGISRIFPHNNRRIMVWCMILGYCINCGALMYGIVGCIYGAVLGLLLAGTVEYIWECFDPTPKGVVIQAAGGNGDWDVDEEAALSPRGELPIARVFERENSKPVEVGNGS